MMPVLEPRFKWRDIFFKKARFRNATALKTEFFGFRFYDFCVFPGVCIHFNGAKLILFINFVTVASGF
jgi:hypothetical protein